MNPDGINNLRIAIIEQAVKDYTREYMQYLKIGYRSYLLEESERFIRSDWCEELCDIDFVSNTLLEKIQISVEHDYNKRKEFLEVRGCGKNQKKKLDKKERAIINLLEDSNYTINGIVKELKTSTTKVVEVNKKYHIRITKKADKSAARKAATIKMYNEGILQKEIADTLGISIYTVISYIQQYKRDNKTIEKEEQYEI